MVGYDSGVHLFDGKYMVVATDPCTGVPEEWFGCLLINYAASDVALSGAKPEFCTINLLGTKINQTRNFPKDNEANLHGSRRIRHSYRSRTHRHV